MVFYNIKAKRTGKTVRATARYNRKEFVKGRTYTVRRKLTPKEVKEIRRVPGFKVISVKKIKRR